MIAKYDYDVYHSSPNIDAEQMEMSFRRGDEIVVFGGESSIRNFCNDTISSWYHFDREPIK